MLSFVCISVLCLTGAFAVSPDNKRDDSGFQLFVGTQAPQLPNSGGVDLNCVDKQANCVAFGKQSCQPPYDKWAKDNCANFCGFCQGPTTPAPACVDKIQNCEAYGQTVCNDPQYGTWAVENCRYFCRKCTVQQLQVADSMTTTIAPERCVDKVDCRLYGKSSCSGNFKGWANENCMNYCGFCVGVPTPPPACVDKINNCDQYDPASCTDAQFHIWATDNCRKHCNLCSGGAVLTPQIGSAGVTPSLQNPVPATSMPGYAVPNFPGKRNIPPLRSVKRQAGTGAEPNGLMTEKPPTTLTSTESPPSTKAPTTLEPPPALPVPEHEGTGAEIVEPAFPPKPIKTTTEKGPAPPSTTTIEAPPPTTTENPPDTPTSTEMGPTTTEMAPDNNTTENMTDSTTPSPSSSDNTTDSAISTPSASSGPDMTTDSGVPTQSPSGTDMTTDSGVPTQSPGGTDMTTDSGVPTQSPGGTDMTTDSGVPTQPPSGTDMTTDSGVPTQSPNGTDMTTDSGVPTQPPSGTDMTTDSGVPTQPPSGTDMTTDSGVPTQSPNGTDMTTDSGVPTQPPSGTDMTTDSGVPTQSPVGTDMTTDSGVPTQSPSGPDTTTDSGVPTQSPGGTGMTTDSGVPTQSPSGPDTTTDSGVPTQSPVGTDMTTDSGVPTQSPVGTDMTTDSGVPTQPQSGTDMTTDSGVPTQSPSGPDTTMDSGLPTPSNGPVTTTELPGSGSTEVPSGGSTEKPATGTTEEPATGPTQIPDTTSPSATPLGPVTIAPSATTAAVTAPSGVTEVCEDKLPNCRQYGFDKVCSPGPYRPWAEVRCRKFCGFCGAPTTPPPCQDVLPNCAEYNDDLCSNPIFKIFREDNCRAFCKLCDNPLAPPTTQPVSTTPDAIMQSLKNNCRNIRTDCDYFQDTSCFNEYESWARRNCALRCGYCPGKEEPCQDTDPLCSEYGADLCTGYEGFARDKCRKFCNLCGNPVPPSSIPGSSNSTGTARPFPPSGQPNLKPTSANNLTAASQILSHTYEGPPSDIPGFCQYKDQYLNLTQTYKDGCDVRCTCLDNIRNTVVCTDVCPTWTSTPSECHLEKVAGECCDRLICSGDILPGVPQVNPTQVPVNPT
ncbi:titin-like isoform X7 [Pecten maximus]|uniref:titin-like isoform X7 n=1 Tax=Pecten maximus TaxID=6579 RepID=UPI001458A55F|nr:titin-like isoform X7 [Pecten maximus]